MIQTIFLILCAFISFVSAVVFSASAAAIGQISRDSLQKLIENKVRGASALYRVNKNKRRFQLMLLAARIATVVAGCFFVFILALGSHANTRLPQDNIPLWLTLYFCAVTLFIVSEAVLSRLLSLGEYEDTVPRFAFFLVFSYVILFPITVMLDTVLSIFIEEDQELAAKEEEFLEIVKSESEAGVLERGEREMIQGVLDFSDTLVREVMIPRIDMVAVDKDTSVDELIRLFQKEGHSRIPVYEDRIDNILGVVYAKDMLSIVSGKTKESISISNTMRKPYFVHETKKISDLLSEFKKNKVHLAIVVDEYGGTAGIVALEDLLEEIVGDIRDEYDTEEREYHWINDKTVFIDAGLDIDEVNEIIHSDIPRDDFDTLAGFIYHQLGIIPKGGEEFNWKDLTFSIRQINGNRISKVLVKLQEPLMKDEDDAE